VDAFQREQEQERLALEQERLALEQEQERLALEQERLALEQERLTLEQERLALEQERIGLLLLAKGQERLEQERLLGLLQKQKRRFGLAFVPPKITLHVDIKAGQVGKQKRTTTT